MGVLVIHSLSLDKLLTRVYHRSMIRNPNTQNILNDRRFGMTITDLGIKYRVSKQRIWQILKANGHTEKLEYGRDYKKEPLWND